MRRPGLWSLPSDGGQRDALLYVPDGIGDDRPRLVVSLHGAGGEPASSIAHFRAYADARRLVLLAPASWGPTWDVILGGWGPDVRTLDAVLEPILNAWPVDPDDVAVSGFSDGASYALSLAVANGDLFRRVLAFSPGFLASAPPAGRPDVFVTHGVADTVLPINRTSRVLVPRLRAAGYQVDYREFSGPHTVPAELVAAGLDWAGWQG